jgi:unsaturated chondroitin disaccharide hydrolase
MVGMGDHDIGFNFTLSTVAAYMVTGKEIYREKAIAAARVLADRFREKGQFIQIAGDENCKDKALYRLIIDCLMNVNLLYWAGETTGDKEFTRRGFAHFNTTMETVIRENGSSFQNFYFDPATGERLGGGTKQGLSKTSCWSRGQSWGVTGVPFTYAYMKNEEIIPKYYTIADYFINHLPTDRVAYWDLDFTDGGEARDSSANAIACCGLIEAVRNMPIDEEHKKKYARAMEEMMVALIDDCATKPGSPEDGLLLHGTYYYAGKLGIDECCIWGDYFYMEALMRLLKPEWKKYW